MSLFLDIAFVKQLSSRLPQFKQKSDKLFNCKCILCGDGSHHKARGYFFPYKGKLFYKCHNCGASMPLHAFLKEIDINLYEEYLLESLKDRRQDTLSPQQEPVPSGDLSLEGIVQPLLLMDFNIAHQYCVDRQIPQHQWAKLGYIEHTKDIAKVFPKYSARLTSEEPRLVIPFYSISDNRLIGVTMRDLLGTSEKRYIMAKADSEEPLIFGWQQLDFTKDVYVVEGPLDSLFLDNAIAVAGTSFEKVEQLPLEDPILIFDNQPRNAAMCKIMEKMIAKDYRVVIWPSEIVEKDINEMVLAHRNVDQIVKTNTYQGLQATLKFLEWRKV